MKYKSLKLKMVSDGIRQSGFVTYHDKYYYFSEKNFLMEKNVFHRIDGKLYYFRENGMALSGWLTLNGKKYYFGSDYVAYHGLKKIGKYYYYFDSDGVMLSNSYQNIDGYRYYFDASGRRK